MAILAMLAVFCVTQVGAGAQTDQPKPLPPESPVAPVVAADVVPGMETQGNNNVYVLLDSTDSNGPTYSDAYSPTTDTGITDDGSHLAPLGFSFTFYGVDYAETYIDGNGFLSFGGSEVNWVNDSLATNTFAVFPSIFGFHDDLGVAAAGTSITYDTFGTPGQQVFVARYIAEHWLGTGLVDFDIRLFEATDRIEVHYHDAIFDNPSYDNGASATVGVRAGDAGSAYLQYSHNTPDIDSGMAIRFWQPTCNGLEVNWVGTRGNDNIGVFGAGDRVWYGHHGADELYLSEGNDTVCGGEGADKIYGGSGNDVIYGSLGGDIIEGGGGNDYLYGGGGNDTLSGQSGIDYLYGQAQNDTLDGGGGADFLFGSTGADILRGGTGEDLVNGGAGIDILNGGADDDLIVGGGGADTINGGAGEDVLRGGGGDDLIEGFDGNDTISGGGGNDTMLGYAGDDRMTGGPGNDSMNGGAGEDNMTGNGGDDNMNGSTDSDIIVGSGGNDTMNGSTGIDTMYGGPGMDVVNGGGDGDFLFGNGDDDTLSGGAGTNSLDGGGGTDTCTIGTAGSTIRCEL